MKEGKKDSLSLSPHRVMLANPLYRILGSFLSFSFLYLFIFSFLLFSKAMNEIIPSFTLLVSFETSPFEISPFVED